MNVTIAGTGITKFGELWGTSPRELAHRAVDEALVDAGLVIGDIEFLVVGNMLSAFLGNQQHVGALFAEELGITGSSYTVEGACASGGLAIHTAVMGLVSGQYKTACVLGIEKMTDHKPELVSSALMAAGTNEERLAGGTFPGMYAMLARSHMQAYGTTEKDLASVAVKNHFHGSLNPKAQYQNSITVQQVLTSGRIADPLKLLDCSPMSDGAAAVILTTKKVKKGVSIIGSAVAVDTLGLAHRASLTELLSTKRAAKKAYQQAGIIPDKVDCAEVHDCFTIAEIMALEDLGLYKKGSAAHAISGGKVTLGSAKHLVVNTSGGLKACGHPVGATGVKQIVEIADQMRGRCGKRQLEHPSIGLAHNVGGSGATAVIHVLKNNQ